MRQRDANLTALAAIGPRKKRKLDAPGLLTIGGEVSVYPEQGRSLQQSSQQQLQLPGCPLEMHSSTGSPASLATVQMASPPSCVFKWEFSADS